MADEVLSTVADGVATITLNRPDKRNAMNAALLSALRDCFDALDGRADVRVVVLRGAGPASVPAWTCARWRRVRARPQTATPR